MIKGVPEQFECISDCAEYRSVPSRPGVELYRAHIVRYAFEAHTHEAYAFGAIETGVQRIRCRGTDHLAPSHSLVLMNPDALHTGRAETHHGWAYRMVYIEPDALAAITGNAGWWFPNTVIEGDQRRAQRLLILLNALWKAPEPLAFDSFLYQLIDEIRPHVRTEHSESSHALHRFAPVLDYIEAHLDQRMTLEELANVADLSPFHFLRQFQKCYGVTPHQMLMARRLHAAKRLLAAGMASIDIALAVGLTDQAHLNRAFVRRYGTTPVRYQRQIRR